MTLPEILGLAALLILVYMIVIWLVSLLVRDASIIDFLWGPGFILVTWLAYLTTDGDTTRKIIVDALVIIWGLRLAAHIYLRNRGRGEDQRYRRWRQQAGSGWWWRSFFQVNLVQGVVMWVVALPLVAAQYPAQPPAFTPLDMLGIGLWLLGFVFEAVADWQLARFKANPANEGQVLDRGLWRYSRHPNYFGEALLWWGLCCFALAVGAWWAIISPLLMTFLLVRVSGVTLLERGLKETRPAYDDYIRRTSSFIPMPPRD
jgi:steroid 5-alpha reductase family enzyme